MKSGHLEAGHTRSAPNPGVALGRLTPPVNAITVMRETDTE